MKLGILSAIFPDLTFEQVIDTAASMNLKSVELACWPSFGDKRRYAGVTHLDPDKLFPKQVEEIKAYCASKNVEISSLGYYSNPLSSDLTLSDLSIRHIYKLIDASADLGVNMVTTFIGRDQNLSVEKNLEKFEIVWTPIIQYAELRKVKVAIENCPMLFTNDEWPGGKNLAFSPAIFRRMFSIIKSDYFGLNFDPSHFVWQQMDYLDVLSEFKDKLFHIHVKDTKVLKDKLKEVGILATPLEYMTPKIPGLGNIDWKAFFEKLRSVGYEGNCVLEIEDRDFEGSFEEILKSIELSIEHVQKYVY